MSQLRVLVREARLLKRFRESILISVRQSVDCGVNQELEDRGYFKPLLSLKRSNRPAGILRLPRSQSCHCGARI